jgi:hypothetical protein
VGNDDHGVVRERGDGGFVDVLSCDHLVRDAGERGDL